MSNISKGLRDEFRNMLGRIVEEGASEAQVEETLLRTCRKHPPPKGLSEMSISVHRELWEDCGFFSYPFPEDKFRAAMLNIPDGMSEFGKKVSELGDEIEDEYISSGRSFEDKFRKTHESMIAGGMDISLDVSKRALLSACRYVHQPVSEMERNIKGFRRVWENVLEVEEEFPEAEFRAAYMEGQ